MGLSLNVGIALKSSLLRTSGAQTLLGTLGDTYGLAIDSTDQSMAIADATTPANNYSSAGTVSSGALVGPGGKLTYTSPSPKMCLQSDGTIKYGAHNLYLNSAAPANQAVTVTSGRQYAITITGTVSITWSGAYVGTTNTPGTTIITAASGTLAGGSTGGSGTVQVYNYPAVTDYIATGASAVYSLPYEWNSSGVCQGLLVEEARTNLLTYSTDVSNAAWSKINVTRAAGVISSVFSGMTPDKLTASGGSGVHVLGYSSFAVTNGSDYTLSAVCKAGDSLVVGILIFSGAAGTVHKFDLSNGSELTAEPLGVPMTVVGKGAVSLGNGWYRVYTTITAAATTNYDAYVYVLQNDGTRIYTPSGTAESIHVQHIQVELGATASSPIMTTSATATRAADDISLANSSYPWSADTQTMYYYGTNTEKAGVTATNISDGNVSLVVTTTPGQRVAKYSDASPLGSDLNGAVSTAYKLAVGLAVGANASAACLNGTLQATPFTNPQAAGTTLVLGDANSGAGQVVTQKYIKQVLVLPRRASNTELQTLATP